MKSVQTRMTRQRKIILEELRKLHSHPTAEEIHARVRSRLPRVSLGTIYRNLDFLAATGEIQLLAQGGSTRRFDGNVEPHCHVRCLRCGKIGDVELDAAAVPPPDAFRPTSREFAITGSRLEFEGYCMECVTQPSPSPGPEPVDLSISA